MSKYFLLVAVVAGAACGGDDAAAPDASGLPTCDDPPGPFEVGDATGHPAPLGAGPGEARAGRLGAGDLPPSTLGLLTWAPGDYVVANDRVALVIEATGDSDLYDPWGGKPVGIARVADGALVDAADFGEVFLMTGPSTLATTSVTVLADGSDGGPAIVRATGRLHRLPFLTALVSALYFDGLDDIDAALDYVLEPGAEHVDVYWRYASPRPRATATGAVLHGFMYTPRMPTFLPGDGFTTQIRNAEWVALVDDDAASWAYHVPDRRMGSSIAASGFVGAFTSEHELAACGTSSHHHARLLIGGPGLDGLEQARARLEGRALRAITGAVTEDGAPLPGARVHARAGDTYLTRAATAADGSFTLHVPADAAVTLTAYRRGWATASADVAAGDATATIDLPRPGAIRVRAVDGDGPLPARVQVLPGAGASIPPAPEGGNEPTATGGRLHVEFPVDGDVTMPVPAGTWRVVVSRGYEYELFETTVTVAAGETRTVDAFLDRVVETPGVQCGDFHVHTTRSNDASDPPERALRSAVADGVELPVRTEHEWVDSFGPLIDALGVARWAFGIGSIEMTSMELWGHMNVFPLEPDPARPNQGAPRWQTWPTADRPDDPLETKSPRVVFGEVRARSERPAIIINHPMGSTNYFGYVGFDPATGMVAKPEHWDDEFTLVEVFNDSHWLASRNGTVRAWFALLAAGRPVFAVGSSDSHGVRSSPIGYPRTCIDVGTDDPRALTADHVRDRLAAGHATVSGGIYLDVSVGGAGPGETATGTGAIAQVRVEVQAATWIDVDALDVVVDGETVLTIPIEAGDADPMNPVRRFARELPVDVAAGGSWVVVAAYGNATLEPVHPGRVPFGVSNPIWLRR